MNYKFITISVILLLTQSLYSQFREPLFKFHDRGLLWETMKDNGQIGGLYSSFQFFPSMDWIGGPMELPNKDAQRSYMQGAGVWIGGFNPDGSVFLDEMGPFSYVDQGTFFDMTEVENFIELPGYDPNEAEEVITAHWITSRGIDVQRISRSWSFPQFADFIIMEYIFTNTSSDNLTDVYFGFPYLIRPSYQDVVVQGGWGDNFNLDDELVGYDDQRGLLYAWDYQPSVETNWSYGNYWSDADELRTPGYAGFAALYSDPASDNQNQPATVFYCQALNNVQRLTLANRREEDLYAIINGSDRSLMEELEPGQVLSPFMLLGYGPYNMAANETLRIVMVEAVNGLPMSEAVKGLSAQSKLTAGLDSLQNAIDRAQALVDNDFVPDTLALAPPSPETEYFILPSTQEIVITWSPEFDDWVDPLTGEQDLKIYRVYRSDRSFVGPFQKLRDIDLSRSYNVDRYFDSDLGKWKYTDDRVDVGVGYFYAVTAIDNDGNESGFTNRNTEQLVTARQPAENALNVSVFPNPFRLVSGLPTEGEESSIVFTNLPEKCTIRIYTVSGELVRTLEHNNPNSGEEVWDQLSDSRQKTAAGMYLYTVQSDVGNAKGTLLLIK